jgi:hypothetical protein
MLPHWGAPSSIIYLPEIPVYIGPFNSGGRVLKWCHGKFKLYRGESQAGQNGGEG